MAITKNRVPEGGTSFAAGRGPIALRRRVAMAHRLLAGADTWLPVPAGYKAVTAALFPRGCGVRLRFAAERPGAAVRRLDSTALFLSAPSLRYVGPIRRPNN